MSQNSIAEKNVYSYMVLENQNGIVRMMSYYSKNDVILETVKEKMDINGVAVYVGIY